jgi:hypothetical protein
MLDNVSDTTNREEYPQWIEVAESNTELHPLPEMGV